MKTITIVGFLLSINSLLSVEANPVGQKIINNTIDDSYEPQELRSKSFKHHRNKLGLSDNKRPAMKMSEMLLQSGKIVVANSAAEQNEDPFDRGNRRILKFGKRVIESIKRHGTLDAEVRQLKSGKYKIDWWKKDRRLERIRKRLSEELERKPELKQRLRSLGWRNASAPISPKRKSTPDRAVVKKPPFRCNNDLKNTLLYKTLLTSFESLRNGVSMIDAETSSKGPAIFVYMPIIIASSQSEIDRINEAMTETPEIDTPTKISLNTFNDGDHDGPVSDFGVVEIASGETSSSQGEESFSSGHSGGQEFDSDRLLQLIPLVVEELRSGLMSEDDRRAFGWIFGKRLWPLLEREASKRPGETMDQDLAMFVFKGELTERDSEKERRRRRQRRHVVPRPIVAEAATSKEQNYDYDFEDESVDDRDRPTNDWSSENFDQEKTNEPSIVELIELAAKYESRKLEEERKKEEEMKRKKQKKWMDDDYDDYSYEYGSDF